MKKKLLGVLFVLGLLLALPSVVSFAEIASGTCGADSNEGGADSVKWVLNDSGTFTISGSGAMADYASANEVPWGSVGAIRKVMIGEGVTNIGACAFSDCTSLNSVTIPKSVTEIGNDAFKNCTYLNVVYYTGTQEEWKDVNVDENSVLTKAFFYYNNYLGGGNCGTTDKEESVKWMLDGYGNLTISGSGDMKDYLRGEAPWRGFGIVQKVMIGKGVTNVGNYAFDGCTILTSVTMSDVTNIGDYAFSYCTFLKSITIPKKATKIGDYAFSGCQELKSVTIPDSVTSIGNGAFIPCGNLDNVYYTGTKAEWDGVEGKGGLDYYLLHYHCGKTADDNVYWALVGDTLTISGSGAMADYADASSVPWNNSITAIKTVGIEDGVTNVGNNAFNGCTKLTSVTISKDATKIGFYAFRDCTSLKSVTIPKSVTTIGSDTFNGCTNLASVIILSRNITSIGNNAFNGCSKLTAIYMPKDCSIDTSAIPESINQIKYEVEHTTEGVNGETIVAITSVTRSVDLNCDSMGNGYYIIKNEAGDGVTLSDVCKPNDDTITHTGYSMRMRKKINAENHVYGCVVDGERRCIDCGAKQTCTGNPSEVKSGNLTYNCYTCGDGIKVVELNLAAA